ncbi:hypothetical protein Vafri_5179 [Volvox africanus]|uniref:SMP domain-containing protein n=1 Tax=Volvox africanus TaxID=51714 RepID=A0A8J4AWQ1_9CHLO|nr:hypothetical protein Vafri_5179 [Volvox africanus]
MSAPFSDKPNPFTELSSEQPASDNLAMTSQPGAEENSRELQVGEVVPDDVAAYTKPGDKRVGRSATEDIAVSSLAEGADATSTATAANDSPILATVAAMSAADIENRARERVKRGEEAHLLGMGGPGCGGVEEEAFQPVRGGVAAAKRAAKMRGVGVPPTHMDAAGGESRP